ncbi:restriction endonuclease subunit S, partial [Brachyspira intermedia]|uniref:restriction endonuclease subunit S n=1 Tax=Brachyspira intermedia TaxID=84377 RepID=UPI0030046FD8
MKNTHLPTGWQEVKLKDTGEILGGGTPSTKNKEYWNGDILWLTPTEVTALKTKYLYDTERKITELGLKNSSAKIIKPNSLIICTRATIGDCCINKNAISTNQGFKSITPNDNYNVVFLYYLINYNRNMLILNSSGSTFLEISKSNLE